MAEVKEYILLETTRPTAPIYLVVNENEQVHQNTLKRAQAFLQIQAAKEDGSLGTLRLKLTSPFIWMDEQIEKGIPANAKFTQAERDAVVFTNGVLRTDLEIVQKFLDAHPQNEGYKGRMPEGVRKLFKHNDVKAAKKERNQAWKRQTEAANKIMEMDLEEAQETMMRLNGVLYTPPADLEDAQNQLIEYLDSVDGAAEEILKEKIETEDAAQLVINKAVFAGLISFDKGVDEVSKAQGGTWVKVRKSDSTLDMDERVRQFKEYLLTDAGKPLYDELKKATERKPKAKKDQQPVQ